MAETDIASWALALAATLIAAASARAETLPQPPSSAAVFSPLLSKPDLPRIEITLSRPGFQGVVLVLTRNPASQAADGFAIYRMNAAETAGLYCHMWIPGDASKQGIAEGEVTTPERPITGEAYALMARLAEAVDAVTRDVAPRSIGFGVIRSVPETIYDQIEAVRTVSGGCN